MVDNETATKVEEHEAPAGESEEILSMESLDSLIADEDPEFAQSLNEIGPDDPGDIDIYNESLDLEYTLEAERKKWQDAHGLKKKLLALMPFLPKISYQFKMKRTHLRLMLRRWKESTAHFSRNAVPVTVTWLKSFIASAKAGVSDGFTGFRAFSLVKKVLFVSLIGVTGASGYLLYRLGTKGLLPQQEDLFIASMADWAQQKYQFDPQGLQESFYDSTRTSQNILLLKKMVVNLRRSSESGPNPMGAFEFLVEGATEEVVVEIKDREPEVEDLFLRTIEDMTFDQVSSGEGKKMLCERLRNDVNRILTKGFVRRVFLKTAIVKP